MTVRGNVEYALKFRSDLAPQRAEIAERILGKLGMADFLDRSVRQLSGGQQQRVSIARTLALNPEIVLFDEPMSALDVETRLSLRAELKRIQSEFGTTMIYITHDQEEAFALSDRIMVMGGGRIHQLDTPEQIISDPADNYVADFVVRNLKGEDGLPCALHEQVAAWERPGPSTSCACCSRYFFLFAAILPLVGMFGRLLDPSSVEAFSSPQFATACINSIVISLTATFISLCCAMVMSWVLCRTRIRFKGAIAVVMTLPMLIPSLAHGMGLVFCWAVTAF